MQRISSIAKRLVIPLRSLARCASTASCYAEYLSRFICKLFARPVKTGLIASALAWTLAIVVLFVFPPASWALAASRWYDLFLFSLLVEFLYFKAWLMFARTQRWTRLGVSLIGANIAFALLYQTAMAAFFWPSLFVSPIPFVILRVLLAVVVGWGVFELILTDRLEQNDS